MFTSFKNNCKNPNFKLGTSEQNKVIASYGKLIGNASADVETVLYAGEILNNITIILQLSLKTEQKETLYMS